MGAYTEIPCQVTLLPEAKAEGWVRLGPPATTYELKPCPLCGGDDLDIVRTRAAYRVECMICGCTRGDLSAAVDDSLDAEVTDEQYRAGQQMAVDAWNRRAQTDMLLELALSILNPACPSRPDMNRGHDDSARARQLVHAARHPLTVTVEAEP